MNAVGIYRLRNTVTGESYIGSSLNLKERGGAHLSAIRNRRHPFPLVQASLDRTSPDAFAFEIIEECSGQNISSREQAWLESEKPALNRFLKAKTNRDNIEAFVATSVRFTKMELAALKALGDATKPNKTPVRTMVRVAVREYIERNAKPAPARKRGNK